MLLVTRKFTRSLGKLYRGYDIKFIEVTREKLDDLLIKARSLSIENINIENIPMVNRKSAYLLSGDEVFSIEDENDVFLFENDASRELKIISDGFIFESFIKFRQLECKSLDIRCVESDEISSMTGIFKDVNIGALYIGYLNMNNLDINKMFKGSYIGGVLDLTQLNYSEMNVGGLDASEMFCNTRIEHLILGDILRYYDNIENIFFNCDCDNIEVDINSILSGHSDYRGAMLCESTFKHIGNDDIEVELGDLYDMIRDATIDLNGHTMTLLANHELRDESIIDRVKIKNGRVRVYGVRADIVILRDCEIDHLIIDKCIFNDIPIVANKIGILEVIDTKSRMDISECNFVWSS